jgi:hypothetical protein
MVFIHVGPLVITEEIALSFLDQMKQGFSAFGQPPSGKSQSSKTSTGGTSTLSAGKVGGSPVFSGQASLPGGFGHTGDRSLTSPALHERHKLDVTA